MEMIPSVVQATFKGVNEPSLPDSGRVEGGSSFNDMLSAQKAGTEAAERDVTSGTEDNIMSADPVPKICSEKEGDSIDSSQDASQAATEEKSEESPADSDTDESAPEGIVAAEAAVDDMVETEEDLSGGDIGSVQESKGKKFADLKSSNMKFDGDSEAVAELKQSEDGIGEAITEEAADAGSDAERVSDGILETEDRLVKRKDTETPHKEAPAEPAEAESSSEKNEISSEDIERLIDANKERSGPPERTVSHPHGTSGIDHGAEAALSRSDSQVMHGNQMKNILPGNSLKTAGFPAFSDIKEGMINMSAGNNRIGVTVNHEELGRLNINLSMNRGHVDILVNTVDRTARDYLENNVQQLIEILRDEGVSVGGFSVSLKDGKNERVWDLINYEHSTARKMVSTGGHLDNAGLISVFA